MQRILVIDDDDAMRGLIKDHLANNYEVVDTGSPENAVAMALEYRPDAILLDLSMPGLSGFEVCQTLSTLGLTQQIPIFIVSGEDPRNQAFCKSLGAQRFFKKPIDFTRLKGDLALTLRTQSFERRADQRIQITLKLNLKGQDQEGNPFEAAAATENVSKGGFLCTCAYPLEEGSILEVSLRGETEQRLGRARLLRVVRSDAQNPRYAFQFLGTSKLGAEETLYGNASANVGRPTNGPLP
jgi:CheY-like chemotaxis protein